MKLYTVYDKKAQTYGAPITQNNDITAMRALRMEVNDSRPGNVLHTNPEDFQLYRLGEFHQDTGQIELQDRILVTEAEKLRNTTKE